MRRFVRVYLFKVILVLIVLELLFLVYRQFRNQPPKPVDDHFEAYAGKTINVKVLRNDSDKEEDSLFIVRCDQTDYARFKIKGNKIEVVIGPEFSGKDSVKYYISDGNRTSSAYIKYLIKENLPPVGNHDLLNLYQWNKKFVFNPLDNDYDREEDSIYLQKHTTPLHGKLIIKDDFNYIPDNNFFGKDSFSYILSDGITRSEEIWVKISRKKIPAIIGKWVDIPLINPGFELPIDGKKYQSISEVPGWHDDKEAIDGAGREASTVPLTEGKMAGYFAVHRGGTIYQPVAERISNKTTTYKLSFLARFSGGSDNRVIVDFIAMIGAYNVDTDPASRINIDRYSVKINAADNGFKRYNTIFKINNNSRFAGKLLVLEFDAKSGGYTWMGIDDIKLSKLVQ